MTIWNEEPVVFDCEDHRLVGILHRSRGTRDSLGVLIVVGGPQYRVGSHRQFVLMARDLAAAGHPVMRFDYRGMGDAGGAPRSFDSIEADLLAAIAAFERLVPDLGGVVVWGLCDAASAIMMSRLPASVKGKVLVNPWVRTESSEARVYLRHYYLRRLLQRDFWRKLAGGAVDVGGAIRQFAGALRRAFSAHTRTGSTDASFVDRMLEGMRLFKGLTLIILSGGDLTAREFEALRETLPDWRQVLAAPTLRCVRLQDADHTFSDRRMLDASTQLVVDWIAGVEMPPG